MHQFTCFHCGGPFTAKNSHAKFCSAYCRGAARELAERVPCGDCGKLIGRSRTGRTPVCQPCRARRHGTAKMYRRGCRCDVCLAGNAERCKAYRAGLKARTGLAQKRRASYVYRDAVCIGCGQLVRGAYDKATPFHRACRESRERAITRRKCAAEKLAKAAAGVPVGRRRPLVQGDCIRCGESFTRRCIPTGYCSVSCRRRDTRSKWIGRGARRAIYERDGWQCQLCMEPVDPNLHYLDDWAASLDHIVPRSHMLIPDHSPENLQLSHRWCNSVKGDGRVDEEFFRVAA